MSGCARARTGGGQWHRHSQEEVTQGSRGRLQEVRPAAGEAHPTQQERGQQTEGHAQWEGGENEGERAAEQEAEQVGGRDEQDRGGQAGRQACQEDPSEEQSLHQPHHHSLHQEPQELPPAQRPGGLEVRQPPSQHDVWSLLSQVEQLCQHHLYCVTDSQHQTQAERLVLVALIFSQRSIYIYI